MNNYNIEVLITQSNKTIIVDVSHEIHKDKKYVSTDESTYDFIFNMLNSYETIILSIPTGINYINNNKLICINNENTLLSTPKEEYILYLAGYNERESVHRLTFVTCTNSLNSYEKNLYKEITKEVYDYLIDREPIGNSLYTVPSHMSVIKSIDVIYSDEKDEEEKIEELKNNYKMKALSTLLTRVTNETVIYMYEFQKVNNILLANNFIITDENRQEKYVDILNTKDIKLIETLNIYLSCNEHLEMVNNIHKKYKEFCDNIEVDGDSKEEVLRIYNEFNESFS